MFSLAYFRSGYASWQRVREKVKGSNQLGGNLQNPDIIFSQAGPITIVVSAKNIPDKTPVQVRVTASGEIITATNNLANGAASYTVTVPKGIGTIQATASFTSP